MATNTTASFTNLTGNGTAGPFNVSFSYLSEAEVDVFVGGVLKTITTHYTFTSATQITFTSGNEPANGAVIKIQRDTNIGAKKVDFNDGSVLTESDLDTQNDQLLFGLQELSDEYVKRNGTQSITGNLVFEGSTDDNNETTLAITDPTADRTITLPDRSGTVITSGDTGTVTSTMIEDGTIVNADVNASAAIAGTKVTPAFGSQNLSTTGTAATGALSVTGNIGVSGTVDGRDVAADGTKLDGIETAATADQTAAEIRTLVEAATDSNVFTDADHTKLNGIETGATADQTDAEIRTAVENATDSNVFTDADHTKLNGIETGATADQTNSEIKTAYEANSDTNAFTDAEKTKLTGISTGADVTSSNSINALTDVNTAGVADGKILKYQASSSSFIIADDTGGSQGATTFTGLTDTPSNYGSAANKTLKVNSSGNAVEFVDVSTDIVNDTTPQLGGNLDVQANEITTSTTNGNIKLNPNGTGVVEIQDNLNISGETPKLIFDQTTSNTKYKIEEGSGLLQLKISSNSGVSYTNAISIGGVGNIFIPDNDKVNFGSGNDLTIVHDGSDSKITNKTGNLLIEAKNGETGIKVIPDGVVELYHDNENKLQTTSYGVEIRGDGSSTDGTIQLNCSQNSHGVKIKSPPHSAGASYTLTLPNNIVNGQFLKTDSSGNLSWAAVTTDLVGDTSPQLGGDLDTNGNIITFGTGVGFSKKTGATNAVVNGVTQHVKQNSLIIDGGIYDLFFTGGSSGSKITFGSSDGATHEVMRITPSVLGASQHGKVELKYVTANAGGSTSSSTKLATTPTGITVTGTVAATSFTGDGSNLTGVSGAKGGSGEAIFYESENTMDNDYTISTNHNALVAGPLTINATLTVNTNSVVTIP